jgi:hypothetical protein
LKSTYRILTKDLDGAPVAKNVIFKDYTSEYKMLFDLEIDINLFDFPICKRVILASNLLTKNITEICDKIDKLSSLSEIVIVLDYYSLLDAVNKLFIKRVLQAVGLIQKIHPEIAFVITMSELNDTTIYEQYKKYLKEYGL